MLVRKKNLSQQEVKWMILSYLRYKPDGANAHNIQFNGIPNTTIEGSRFKKLLEELCLLGCLEKIDVSYVTKGREIYRITNTGRETIDKLNEPLVKVFLGFREREI